MIDFKGRDFGCFEFDATEMATPKRNAGASSRNPQ
jgi:hypothetical protein